MKNRAVAITGLGAICAIGRDVPSITDALMAGRSGIGPLRVLDLPFPDLVFGEVGMSNAELATQNGLDPSITRSRTFLLALHAAKEALRQAAVIDTRDLAVISASTVGGMDQSETHFAEWSGGSFNTDAQVLRSHPVGDHTTQLARAIGAEGMIATISTACSSSANAIMLGAQLIRTGRTDRVLVGGSDALCRFTIEGFRSLGALDPQRTRPFTETRGGLNLGEGAAYLVLEALDVVWSEGRTPLALFAGGANRNDAHHQTATSVGGAGPYEAMSAALHEAGLEPTDIDHINAHGTGTENNDTTELTAIERLFENVPPFTSTKSLTGHTLAAAGALEAVFSILSITRGFIPFGATTETPMTGHRSIPVNAVIRKDVRAVLSNSFGFGGNDSALVFTSIR